MTADIDTKDILAESDDILARKCNTQADEIDRLRAEIGRLTKERDDLIDVRDATTEALMNASVKHRSSGIREAARVAKQHLASDFSPGWNACAGHIEKAILSLMEGK